MVLYRIIFASLFFVYFSYAGYNKHEYYAIPNPEVIVYANGLKVSIPDEEGIEAFYFQGTIERNSEEEEEEEPDIISMGTRFPTNGKWVLAEGYSNFKVGDSFNYWLYVKKNGVGFRKPFGSYKVKVVSPKLPEFTGNGLTKPHNPGKGDVGGTNIDCDPACVGPQMDCEDALRNMNETIRTIQSQMDYLRNTIKMLAQTMDTHIGNLSYLEEWTWN